MKKILTMAAMLSMCVFGLKAQVILQDSFSYADGITTNVSGGLWKITPNATTTFSYVIGGRLEVFSTRGDDINRPFDTAPSSTVLYASFVLNSTNLSNSTNYFAHFKDASTLFRARVFAAGPGVAANTWRLGISAGGGAGTQINVPMDLATNVDYTVVTSYDTVNRVAKIWIDPVVETDANTVSGDTTTAATLVSYGFRQSGPNPNLTVDNLYVGNAFSDVIVGTPKPPTIYYQPPVGPITNFVGNNATLSCVGAGAGTVTFQWQHAGTNLVDNANYTGTAANVLSFVSAVVDQTGNYRCIVTSTTNSIFAGSVTSVVAQVVVSAAPVPPSFITQPVSQTIYSGQTVVFSTTVSSPGNVTYQWKSNNVDIAGENLSTLTLVNVSTNLSGYSFRVAVTNDVVPNGILSSNAVLTVTNPPIVTVAYLRSLVDPVTLLPNVPATSPYQVTGTITTYTNVTTGNTASYWLQDGTGGINIFATLGQTFRPLQGDSVTFVGVLSSFTSGLELVADPAKPYTSYVINSSGNALPAAKAIPFTLTNTVALSAINTNYAGSLVTLSGVYFGTNFGGTIAGGTVTVTNAAGVPFNLSFFAQDLDTTGQILPEFAYSVTGVLYGLSPNYSLAVTKFSDIVTTAPLVPIPLTTTYSGGSLTFNWSDASFDLQDSTNVVGPYITIPGATTGFITNTTEPTMFFRLYHP